jgi:hypothetical protein
LRPRARRHSFSGRLRTFPVASIVCHELGIHNPERIGTAQGGKHGCGQRKLRFAAQCPGSDHGARPARGCSDRIGPERGVQHDSRHCQGRHGRRLAGRDRDAHEPGASSRAAGHHHRSGRRVPLRAAAGGRVPTEVRSDRVRLLCPRGSAARDWFHGESRCDVVGRRASGNRNGQRRLAGCRSDLVGHGRQLHRADHRNRAARTRSLGGGGHGSRSVAGWRSRHRRKQDGAAPGHVELRRGGPAEVGSGGHQHHDRRRSAIGRVLQLFRFRGSAVQDLGNGC